MNDEHFKAAAHGVLTVCAVLESFSAKTSTRRALLLGMAVFHAHLFVADLRDAQALAAAEKRPEYSPYGTPFTSQPCRWTPENNGKLPPGIRTGQKFQGVPLVPEKSKGAGA